ncbi:zinc-ribbon domain-containing protein [Patescibacteria group bacterium]|nr:zinc-ribbon domain-containing protein [Patescibacteria group bacterium]
MITKQCKECSKTYKITDQDQDFYNQLNVPQPTLCPDCRAQRRMARRNERSLYQDKCDLCGKDMLSVYSPDSPYIVYCRDCWYSDKWDATSYGREFDFNRSFFEQFIDLQKVAPRINLIRVDAENSDYVNVAGHIKNCYLVFGSINVEDCLYGNPYYSKNCVDTLSIRNCEICYECISSDQLYNCLYCQDCFDSNNLLFCYDCKGCTECIGSAGLRNQSHVIFNKQFSEEDYKKEKARINLCNPESFKRVINNFEKQKLKHPRKFMVGVKNENVTGNYINQAKNVFNSFDVQKAENCNYLTQILDTKDAYDVGHCEESELMIEQSGAYKINGGYYNFWCYESSDLYYSDWCGHSKNLFGCCCVDKAEYSILNKNYSPEEYEKLKIKIINHMKKTGEWGEFFLIKDSYFGYNETIANDYYPLKKDDVLNRGWKWKDEEVKISQSQTFRVPQNIEKVSDSIINEVLACEDCRKNYKITKQELDFYKRMKLPIPKFCFECRHKKRLAMRTPRSLWQRQCMCTKIDHGHQGRCHNEFETAYDPAEKEMVYCEDCYNKEIY